MHLHFRPSPVEMLIQDDKKKRLNKSFIIMILRLENHWNVKLSIDVVVGGNLYTHWHRRLFSIILMKRLHATKNNARSLVTRKQSRVYNGTMFVVLGYCPLL